MSINSLSDLEGIIIEEIALLRGKFQDKTNYFYSLDNPIASFLNISINEVNNLGIDALYIPNKNKIVMNSNIDYIERKIFSFFHEITHSIILKNDDIISFLMQFHAGREEEFKDYIESLCNLGAGEFLAPINQIKDEIAKNEFSIKLLINLDQIFPASKPAIIFQLARSASHKCTLVVVERGFLPKHIQPRNSMSQPIINTQMEYFILYSATSRSNKYRPGRFTIIPKHHILRNAYEEQSFIKGEDYIPYASGYTNHHCRCEAMYYSGKVFGLFNLENPINTNLQPRLL